MSPQPSSSIILATRNRGKIRELATLLAAFRLTVLGVDAFPDIPEVEETGATFLENALLKAREVSRASGLVAVADDSGLCVDALDGRPGVHSARYSEGPDQPATDERNIEKLLAVLQGLPPEKRGARFHCCMVAATPTGSLLTAEGTWQGTIAASVSGRNGFGYDPVFLDPEIGCTAAEMSANEKNARSHRAKAVSALLAGWPNFWEQWLRGSGFDS